MPAQHLNRTAIRYLALFVTLLGLSRNSRASDEVVCAQWINKPHSKQIGQVVLTISRRKDRQTPDLYLCRAQVKDRRGKLIYSIEDYAIGGYRNDIDVNNDGSRDLIIETYSGGAHCCWTYSIVATENEPGLIVELFNEREIDFESGDRDKEVEIWALDGSFDYFDGMAHAFSYFPTLVLQIHGNAITDISSRFRAHYDREIAQARRDLTPERLRPFSAAKKKSAFDGHYEETASSVLQIVLSYLYSGRQHQAWQALHEMWPAFERERMWKLILRTRAKGLRRYLTAAKRS